MELNVPERVALLDVLASFQGSFLVLVLIRKLRGDLVFSDTEVGEFGIEETPGRVTWKQNGVKDIPVGEKARGIVAEALAKLDIQEQLGDRHFSLYEKFMGQDC